MFYLLGTLFVSGLVQIFLIRSSSSSDGVSGTGAFFPGSGGEIDGIDERGKIHTSLKDAQGKRVIARKGAWRDVWLGGGVMGEALSGFVLGWAGVGGILR